MIAVCLGDLHISLRSNELFEGRRLNALALELNSRSESTLILLGDVFDRNKPSLQEIQLFYQFVSSLQFTEIFIISGNHDPTVFQYLPQTNFKYLQDPTIIDDCVFVGYNNLERFMNDGVFTDKSKILFTHARCTIAPYIKEEVDFKLLSEKYDMVVLGDIHHPCAVQDNVYYTYEPTNNSFVKYKKKTTGYLVIDTELQQVTRVFPELPHKDILKVTTVEGLDDIISELSRDNLYKITVEAPLADRVKLTDYWHNVIWDFIPQIDMEQQEEEVELKQLVNRKVSIEDTLLQHTQTTYKFSLDVLNQIKRRLREVR